MTHYYIRLHDGHHLYLNEENEYGDQCITAKEMTTHNDKRFLWTRDSETKLLRSVYDPFGCISHSDVRYHDPSNANSNVADFRSSLVLKNVDELDNFHESSWSSDIHDGCITLLNSQKVMDQTQDNGRICVYKYHGECNQKFTLEPSRDYFYIRLEDRRCLYLNPSNEHSELLITAEQMATLEDDRFLWFLDEERGLIRSAWGRFGCITHEDAKYARSSEESNRNSIEYLSSLVFKDVDELDNLDQSQWSFDSFPGCVTLTNTDLVMEVVEDSSGSRVTVNKHSGKYNQLFCLDSWLTNYV